MLSKHSLISTYSYNGHYKKLIENMEKNELALKGDIDGVELLIYCSNQLPVKAHRKIISSQSL